jgi:TPR repeat protein
MSNIYNNIGLSYLHGLGVIKDKNKAFEWFEKAAKQGLSYAQSELAMLYYQQGKTKQAQQWWLTAANANDEYAQFNLASLFLEKNNIKKATYWFQRVYQNLVQYPQTD